MAHPTKILTSIVLISGIRCVIVLFLNPLLAQCPDNQLISNPSFEDFSCCPETELDFYCVNEWYPGNNLSASTDYYHECGYIGVPGVASPPSGYPDGQGCILFKITDPFRRTYIQTCISTSLDTNLLYQFSAYLGYNYNGSNPAAWPVDPPALLSFYGHIGTCEVIPDFPTMCPIDTAWDFLVEISYDYPMTGEGWVSGISDCFQPAKPYNQIIVFLSCIQTENGDNYLDLVELRECQPMLSVDMVITASCGVGANGSVNLSVTNGTPPYMYDWDIDGTGDFDDDEDQTGLAPGSYQVVVMDTNGVERCLELYVPGRDVIATSFDPIGPLCQYDASVVLPSTSTNSVPVTGMWVPDFIVTDTPGVYTYTFYPDTIFCADSFVQMVRIIRQAVDTGRVDYLGCMGDGHQEYVNGTIYHENNPTGQEIINTNTVCDSVVEIELIFQDNTSGIFEYTECSGSGYAININNTVYNENNPTGTEILMNTAGCDSMLMIDLEFLPNTTDTFDYTGCEDDGYSITVNGMVYNETHPTGVEFLPANNGCDSVLTIDLNFQADIIIPVTYNGCFGDGFSIMVNGTLYNESNPVGVEMMQTNNGCDSIININLTFSNHHILNENHQRCAGDNFSILVNGTTYNELNPQRDRNDNKPRRL